MSGNFMLQELDLDLAKPRLVDLPGPGSQAEVEGQSFVRGLRLALLLGAAAWALIISAVAAFI